MSIPFKDGDWFANDDSVTPELLKAAHAVCGLTFPEECEWEDDKIFFEKDQECLMTLGIYLNPDQKHTITEWLFKGAPDWAVDLRLDNPCYHYTDGKYQSVSIKNNPDTHYEQGRSIQKWIIIATRKSATETADDWYDYENNKMQTEPNPGEIVQRLDLVDQWQEVIFKGKFGNQWWIQRSDGGQDKIVEASIFRPLDHDKDKKLKAENIWDDIKKCIGKNTMSPATLVRYMEEKGYCLENIQSVIHNKIDLANLEFGPHLLLKLPNP